MKQHEKNVLCSAKMLHIYTSPYATISNFCLYIFPLRRSPLHLAYIARLKFA